MSDDLPVPLQGAVQKRSVIRVTIEWEGQTWTVEGIPTEASLHREVETQYYGGGIPTYIPGPWEFDLHLERVQTEVRDDDLRIGD